MEKEEVLHISPYVLQIEKFADSLKQLSNAFLQLEDDKKTFSNQEIQNMFFQVKTDVCSHCEKCEWCWKENLVHTFQMSYEVLGAIEEYGNELNVEMKRKLEARCIHAPRYLRSMLSVFCDAKHNLLFEKRMMSSREGCASQLDTFADMIRMESRELEDSIITDTRMEKRLESELQKVGVKVLYTTFLINSKGRYEIYLTACSKKGENISYKEFAKTISMVTGRRMVTQNIGQGNLTSDYATTVFIEVPMFYTLYGIAKIGKDCKQISGDSFMVIDLSEGRKCMALSDGMGSGEKACRESSLVVDLLEELLKAGYPEKIAIQMINTALVMGREEICFSTIDLCTFDLYEGICTLYKAGASTTFMKRGTMVEHISSKSLPVGVTQKMEVDDMQRQLDHGDFVIMVTDGIMDALPVGEQDIILETIIKGTDKNNAKEMAHHILEQVLEWNGREPLDDMTVLVASLWRFV